MWNSSDGLSLSLGVTLTQRGQKDPPGDILSKLGTP